MLESVSMVASHRPSWPSLKLSANQRVSFQLRAHVKSASFGEETVIWNLNLTTVIQTGENVNFSLQLLVLCPNLSGPEADTHTHTQRRGVCVSTASSSSCCWPTDQPTRVDKDDFIEATKRSQRRPFTLWQRVEQLRGGLFTHSDAGFGCASGHTSCPCHTWLQGGRQTQQEVKMFPLSGLLETNTRPRAQTETVVFEAWLGCILWNSSSTQKLHL